MLSTDSYSLLPVNELKKQALGNPGGLFFYIVRQKKRNDGIIGSGKKCFAKFIIT